MRPIAYAAIRSGLIDKDILLQCQRWGFVPRDLDIGIVEEPHVALDLIQEALENEDQVRLQNTDLDLLKFYLNTDNQYKGQLTIVDKDLGTRATKTIVYARREIRVHSKAFTQYIIPWLSESIAETMTNGETFLKYKEGDKKMRVYFVDVHEMYFGDVKAFMICDALEEADDGTG